MIAEMRASLARHLPGLDIRSMTRLGEGSDNVVYEVNGELIVRRSKEADSARRSALIQREAQLMAAVREFATLPVPEFVFADDEAGVVAYAKLRGEPLNERPVAEPERLAATLGRFAGQLHEAPVAKMETLVPRETEPLGEWLREAERDYRQIADRIPATHRRAVEDFLGRTPPAPPRATAFCHNDLGAEHVLVDAEKSTITGIIDWTDAAITDPMCDLALIYRDLGPEVFDLALAHYTGRIDGADRERAVFYARCALIEDIAYGLRTGADVYARSGLAHLARTFA